MTFEDLEIEIKANLPNLSKSDIINLIKQFEMISDPYIKDEVAHSQYNEIIQYLTNELDNRNL